MMHTTIKAEKDPLGQMLVDYLDGATAAGVEVLSTTLDMWSMTGRTMFRGYAEMDALERCALRLCEGMILDVGAGSGCHSLFLQQQGRSVDALDISPGCVEVMTRRKVKNILHNNLFALDEQKYQTVLMLMNGLGICGSLDGCNLFLQFVKTIMVPGGQVIADSTDLGAWYGEAAVPGQPGDAYYGETEFVMKYKDITSDRFGWLYVDYPTLETLVHFNGLRCELVMEDGQGKFLARIY